jgi:hypothetical protein
MYISDRIYRPIVQYHRFDGHLVKHFMAQEYRPMVEYHFDGHLVKHFIAHDS